MYIEINRFLLYTELEQGQALHGIDAQGLYLPRLDKGQLFTGKSSCRSHAAAGYRHCSPGMFRRAES